MFFCVVPLVCMVGAVICVVRSSSQCAEGCGIKAQEPAERPTNHNPDASCLGVGGPFLRMHGNAINDRDVGEDPTRSWGKSARTAPYSKAGAARGKPPSQETIHATCHSLDCRAFRSQTRPIAKMSGLANKIIELVARKRHILEEPCRCESECA